MANSTGRRAIESYRKHEALVDGVVRLGLACGLQVAATDNNDPHGDIRVATVDKDDFLAVLGRTIDKRQAERARNEA